MPLYLEIVTPEGIAWKSDEVDAVTLPTRAGEIQILEGHIPLVSILEPGELKVLHGDKEEDLAVDKGYVRCAGNVVSVLTEAAIDIKDIDVEKVEEAKQLALKALEDAKNRKEVDESELERLESAVRFAVIQQLIKRK